MIDNPERLWCARINAHENQIIRCHETTGPTDWEGYEPSLDAPVQEYVRADVAAAATADAVTRALKEEQNAMIDKTLYNSGYQAGKEAAVREFWRSECERISVSYEADAMTLINAYAGSLSEDISHHGWALAQALNDRAAQYSECAHDENTVPRG